jgi:hypothetical protein
MDTAIVVDKDGKKHEERVAWFTQHKDQITNTPYIAKSRVALAAIPYLYGLWPQGFVPLYYNKGLEQYFKFINRIPSLLAKKGINAAQST